jgi:hypothetical protein
MRRLALLLALAGGIALSLLAAPALAGSSLVAPGYANWFYFCGEGRPMNLAIRHDDGTYTLFSLSPGERTRSAVRRGDVVAWRCGAPVMSTAPFISITTVP